jgi:hypothetical protein
MKRFEVWKHRVQRAHDRLSHSKPVRHWASLEVVSPLGIPSQFTLLIVADRLRCGCTVIWRTEHLIGVKFH